MLSSSARRLCLPREWFIALGILLLVTLALQAPYALGYLTAPRDTFYTGLLVNVEDANYIAIIQRGSEGAWMHSLRFTSEPDAPAFLYIFYLALGHAARVLQLDATAMWHLARVGLTLICFGVVFGFTGNFFRAALPRWTAFLVTIFGAGFDWLAFPWETLDPTSATPADLKMADAHLFHAALTFPHYLASITLLLILFWCALRLCHAALGRGKFIALLFVGALAMNGVGLVYPFFLILAGGVLGMYGILLTWRAKKILRRQTMILLALSLAAAPLALYYAYAFASSELLRVWAAQSQTLSPHPLHYALTFAPYWILAALVLRRDGLGDNQRLLLWAWVFVVALLIYAPSGAQRRFLQGVQIPLTLLATFGLFEIVLPRLGAARWFQKLARRPHYSADGLQKFCVTLFVLFVSLASLLLWLGAAMQNTLQQPYPFFRPRAEIQAMDWLRAHANPNDIILSQYFSGSYLPLRSGARVYLGHVYETIHFQTKQNAVDQFFDSAMSDAARQEFLRANGITFVFYGPAERAVGTFDPARLSGLERVYENANVAVYRIALP